MLELKLAGFREEHVDDDALGRRKNSATLQVPGMRPGSEQKNGDGLVHITNPKLVAKYAVEAI